LFIYKNNIQKKEEFMEEGICENTVIHEDTVKNVKEKMPEDGLIYDIAELFKVFADSTRMKIIYALMEEELCVCDIANIVQTTQSAISHQLRILKQSKLVKYRKEGKVVYYSLDDEHISQIVKKGREHIEEL
jgi:Predicted transcriptional regulators